MVFSKRGFLTVPDAVGRPVAERSRPGVVMLRWVEVRVRRGDRVLLVLHPSSRAETVRQVIGIFGVAVAVLHTVCAHNCTVETCSQGGREGGIRGGGISDSQANNKQLCVNTVVWATAVIIPDAEQAFTDSKPFIVMQHSGERKHSGAGAES